jgi:hypothetical protein
MADRIKRATKDIVIFSFVFVLFLGKKLANSNKKAKKGNKYTS